MSDNLNHGLVDFLIEDRNFNSSKWTSAPIKGYENDYIIEGTAVGGLLSLEINEDATVNYREYYMRGLNLTRASFDDDTVSLPVVLGSTNSAKPSAFRIVITSDPSIEKFINSFASITGGIYIKAIYWKNTLDEPISISLYDTVSRVTSADFRLYKIPKTVNLDNYDLVNEITFDNQSTDVVFSGLNGDVDKDYLLIGSEDSGRDLIGSLGLSVANIKTQILRNTGGIVASNSLRSDNFVLNKHSSVQIKAESGRVRLCTFMKTDTSGTLQSERAQWDPNTLDNVTDITISNLLNSTGKVSLYKRKSNKTIDPIPMVTVVEYDVDADFSNGITITDIKGNSINGPIKIEHDLVGASSIVVSINNDSGTVYPGQSLIGKDSTVSATLPDEGYFRINSGGDNEVKSGSAWLYPKSGQNRPILVENVNDEDVVEKRYYVYENTLDEVVRIDISALTTSNMKGKIRVSVPKISENESGLFTTVTN